MVVYVVFSFHSLAGSQTPATPASLKTPHTPLPQLCRGGEAGHVLLVSAAFSAQLGVQTWVGWRSFPENAGLCKSRGVRK